MRHPIATFAALLLLAAPAPAPHGRGAPPRGDALRLVCEPTLDRNVSCRATVCADGVELCPGAEWIVCYEECRAGLAEVAWCPGGVGRP
jgi:hypothetical protein